MTDEKWCPFTLGNNIPSYCLKEKCMAWEPETTRNEPIMRWGENGKVLRENKTYPGHCKLIERR